MDWNSNMDEAPRDGTPVDLWGINLLTWDKRQQRVTNVSWGTVVDWLGSEREYWRPGCGEWFEPTHWAPITPPQTQGNGGLEDV